MNAYEKIQGIIRELLDEQRPYEEFINNSVRLKELELLIMSVLSYADGISILMNEKKYDSVFPISRSFIELYPSIIYMIENLSDTGEFDKYFRKLIVDDMVQDLAMYKSLKSDVTTPESDKKSAILTTYISRWENMIHNYFSSESGRIVEDDKESSLMTIISDLKSAYVNAYHTLCGNKNEFIGNALKRNKAVLSATGYPYEDSFWIYRYLCSETHGNIGALDDRIAKTGVFIANISSKKNAEAAADLVYWSLKDISLRLKELLENSNNH